MAIKPITDKQLIDKQTVNRETQTSQKNINTRVEINLKKLYLVLTYLNNIL